MQWRGPYDLERVVLEYDFLRPWKFGRNGFQADETLAPLAIASQLRVVTLFATEELLLRGIASRRRRETLGYLARMRLGKLRRMWKQARKLETLYRQSGAALQRYREWLDYCDARPGNFEHSVIDRTRSQLELQPVGRLRALIGRGSIDSTEEPGSRAGAGAR
jgi:hypothetical protein